MLHNKARGICGALLGVALLAACGGGGDVPTASSSTAGIEASAAGPPGVQASADGAGRDAQRKRTMAVPGGSAQPAVAGGRFHSLALKSDGTVWAWGAASFGKLGNAATTGFSAVPVRVLGPGGAGALSGVTSIAAGEEHSLALKSDGTVWAWGYGFYGNLGNNSTTNRSVPVQVVGAGGVGVLTGVTAIAPGSGAQHSLALKSDGTVWAWGYNEFGQLGNNSTTHSSVPVQVLGAGGTGVLSGVTAIAVGYNHSLALKVDGTVWAWGRNNISQLGNTGTNSSVPVQVSGSGGTGALTGATTIAAGWFHSLALKSDGTVWAWGSSISGQVGSNAPSLNSPPVQVPGPGGVGVLTGVTSIAAGEAHSLAQKSDGTVWGWGRNSDGQLGNNSTTNSSVPVQVLAAAGTGPLTGVTAIAGSAGHSLALKADGTVWAWGDNFAGELGNDRTPTDSSVPVQVRLTAPRSYYGDFNGDGRSDILWRNTATGQVVIWLMNGTGIIGSGAPATVTTDWAIEGVGDFNGDGKADIAWRNTASGQVVIWLMDGTSIIGSGAPASVPVEWVIQGFGDFNADGKADIVWRNVTTGQVVIWQMNGTGITSSGAPATVIADWAIQGFGDYNGDGKADIAWRNPNTGQVVIWLMNGTAISGSGATATVGADWAIQGFGDFNADGKADIGWRHVSTGQVAIWLMNGTDIIGSGAPATVSAEWAVQGFGDFNGDGKADIAWRDATTGQVAIWLMNGTGISSSGAPATVSADWQIAPP